MNFHHMCCGCVCRQLEGAQYCCVLALHVLDTAGWQANKLMFLRRLLVTAHARHASVQAVKTYVRHDRNSDVRWLV